MAIHFKRTAAVLPGSWAVRLLARNASTRHEPLNRQKLDVVNKTRSNIFDWRGKFTPEFVAP